MSYNNGAKINILLREVNELMKHRLKNSFDELGLTAPQIFVITLLHKHKSLKISELSEKLSLSNSTVSGIIDRLEKNNFVNRIRSDKDRRVVRVSLTEEAHSKMKTTFQDKFNHAINEQLIHASEEEVKVIIKGLSLLKDVLQKD